MGGLEFFKPVKWLICVCVIILSISGMFRIGKTDRNWSLRLSYINRAVLSAICAINALCIIPVGGDNYEVLILLSIFAGCILAAAVMDWWEQMVYRFVWWAAGAAGLLLLILKALYIERECGFANLSNLLNLFFPLCVFIVLQQFVFARFYGRADCHAFCVCAIMLTFMNQTFSSYLYHMAIVFVCLALVQIVRGNIKLNGRLKKPVPLVPYIAVAFWLWVDFTVGRC